MEKTKHLSISRAVMLSMEMTREALRRVLGQDFPWKQADIDANSVTECDGWFQVEEDDPRYPLHQEVERVIRLKCLVGQSGKKDVATRSTCRIYNNRDIWEPHWVEVEIDDTRHRFYFACFRDGRLVDHVWKGSPIPDQA